jgi:transcriptional regulator with XRE-family HTH domain
MASIAQIFGGNVYRIRYDKHMTQRAVAEHAGISAKFMSQLERGLKPPNLTVVVGIARALGVPVAAVVADFDPQPPPAGTTG